jgi:hypothetical protein
MPQLYVYIVVALFSGLEFCELSWGSIFELLGHRDREEDELKWWMGMDVNRVHRNLLQDTVPALSGGPEGDDMNTSAKGTSFSVEIKNECVIKRV